MNRPLDKVYLYKKTAQRLGKFFDQFDYQNNDLYVSFTAGDDMLVISVDSEDGSIHDICSVPVVYL